jgi:hypothetical protein
MRALRAKVVSQRFCVPRFRHYPATCAASIRQRWRPASRDKGGSRAAAAAARRAGFQLARGFTSLSTVRVLLSSCPCPAHTCLQRSRSLSLRRG